MRVIASYVMAAIPMVLLILYGADVAVGGGAGGDGFLPLSSAERGIILGMPSVILPIAAFVISWGKHGIPLGIMIIASGVMIIAGGVVGLTSATDTSMESQNMGLVGVGAVIAGLGGVTCARITTRKDY